MNGTVAFEVEFLTGVSVAATPQRRERTEWPPHPDRLFQGLVAAWGRNDVPDVDEQHALEWLESLPADCISVSAPKAAERQVVTAFVPPNDARTTRDPTNSMRVIPELRKNRQPRAFPAAIPLSVPAVVHYSWELGEDAANAFETHKDALAKLAREVTYLGHSHSLVRVSLSDALPSDDNRWMNSDLESLRLPHKGRLDHLRNRFRETLERKDGRIMRPNPSLVTRNFTRSSAAAPRSYFDSENVMALSDAGGFCPSLEAFPLVAKRLRDALLNTAQRHKLGIPTLLSGHESDGTPTSHPHISIIPFADVGWAHSQGRLMGLGLVWPRSVEKSQRGAALMVLAKFLEGETADVPLLHFGRDGSWSIKLDPDSERASLSFNRYAEVARRWGTVLPVVLDRHPKDKPGEHLVDIVVQACLNIGFPKTAIDGIEIEFFKYAPVHGAPSARAVRNALAEDSPYRNRPIAHLVVTFPQPVQGPVILGAGRFRGLGLCLPLGESSK